MSRQEVLIEAVELNARLRAGAKLVVLAVGSATQEGIPGAIPVDPADFAGAGGGTKGVRPLPEIVDLQARARIWGLDDDSEVVLYDSNGGLSAARGWWTLKWAGLSRVRLLDGGLAAWEEADLPFATLSQPPGLGTVSLSAGHLPQIEADEAADFARHDILLDARNDKAFAAGHIPGARNLPASGNLDGNDRFLPDEALHARYSFRDGARIAVSCGSGVSAAHDIAALAILGIRAPLYVGSWSGWSADPSRPVALEAA